MKNRLNHKLFFFLDFFAYLRVFIYMMPPMVAQINARNGQVMYA
jgi:hypothetical protein